MKDAIILIDKLNLSINGKRFSSLQKGVEKRPSEFQIPLDWSWNINLRKTVEQIANFNNVNNVIKVIALGKSIPNDPLLNFLNQNLWSYMEVDDHFHDTVLTSTALLVYGATELIKCPNPGILKIVAVPMCNILINFAHENDWETELWDFSPNISAETGNMVCKVKPLDSLFNEIGEYD
jgi:hypothetical protein